MRILFFLIALPIAIVYLQGRRPSAISGHSAGTFFAPREGEKFGCHGKSRCVVVYLAPWCPACVQFKATLLPSFLQVLQNFPELGLRLVIGRDRMEKIEAMAQDLALPIEKDAAGKLYAEMGIKGVPSFVVLGPTGRVFKHETGFRAQGRTAQEAAENFLRGLLD